VDDTIILSEAATIDNPSGTATIPTFRAPDPCPLECPPTSHRCRSTEPQHPHDLAVSLVTEYASRFPRIATHPNIVQRLRAHGHHDTPARGAARGTSWAEDLDTPERGAIWASSRGHASSRPFNRERAFDRELGRTLALRTPELAAYDHGDGAPPVVLPSSDSPVSTDSDYYIDSSANDSYTSRSHSDDDRGPSSPTPPDALLAALDDRGPSSPTSPDALLAALRGASSALQHASSPTSPATAGAPDAPLAALQDASSPTSPATAGHTSPATHGATEAFASTPDTAGHSDA
jgi:hypothetical protein